MSMPALLCTLLALTLAAQAPTVSGQVLDDDGVPLAGVAVCPFVAGERFVTAELAARPETTSGTDGTFRLAAPSPRDGRAWDRVLLVAPGRLHMEATRAEIERFPVVLPRGRVLAGRVYRADGTAAAGVRVEATDLLQEVDYVLGTGRRRLTPLARTAARTDARGAFVLAGACESAARVAIADSGWRVASVAPVSAMEPIELVTEASPALDGGGGDRDAAATPRARRLEPVDPARTVRVRAVDPEGRPVAHFRAAAFRVVKPSALRPTDGRAFRDFALGAVAASEGEAAPAVRELAGFLPYKGLLVPRTLGRDTKTILLVLALGDGFALTCHQAEETTDAVLVRFAAAHSIRGTVVDAKTRVPIAGARVWAMPRFEVPLPPMLEGVPVVRVPDSPFGPGAAEASSLVSASEAEGRFRLDQLAAGACDVLCVAEGYKDSVPRRVVVAPETGEIQIELDPLRILAGTLQMRAPPLAVAVRLTPHRPGHWSSTEENNDETDDSSSFALDREGRFRTSPLPTGEYEAELIVLRPCRQGMPDKIPLGLVEIGLDTEELRLDGTAARPAEVRGRVEGDTPAQRLAVLSASALAPLGGRLTSPQLRYSGPLCPLAADGTFALSEPPGPRVLVVIDVWTGAMLWRGGVTEVEPGGRREVNVRVDAVRVAFRIEGAGFEPALSYRVAISPRVEHWPSGVGQIGALPTGEDPTASTFLWATLSPGQAAGVLYLPRAPCELVLRLDKGALVRMAIDPRTEAGRDVRFVLPPK